MSPAPRGRSPGRGRRARALGESWWSQRFLSVLETFDSGFRVDRGHEYARRGRVRNLTVEPGKLQALVQGTRRAPYSVQVTYPPLAAEEWARVERAMAAQALFAARLLAGELPHQAEAVFQDCGVSLFPDQDQLFRSACTCPDEVNPCKHVAALFYKFAEELDRDPFLLFRWRGRSRERLIADLRALRGGQELDEEADRAGGDGGGRGAERRATFWDQEVDLQEVPIHPVAAEVPDAVLRQLGPSGVRLEDRDLVVRLRPLYEAITAEALRRALGDQAPRPD